MGLYNVWGESLMYQALYRKYRSQNFSQLVGQEVVAKTLKQAVEQEKISHAYLFLVLVEREKPVWLRSLPRL